MQKTANKISISIHNSVFRHMRQFTLIRQLCSLVALWPPTKESNRKSRIVHFFISYQCEAEWVSVAYYSLMMMTNIIFKRIRVSLHLSRARITKCANEIEETNNNNNSSVVIRTQRNFIMFCWTATYIRLHTPHILHCMHVHDSRSFLVWQSILYVYNRLT